MGRREQPLLARRSEAARSHLWGASPADLHGSARRVSAQARSYRAVTGEKAVEASSSGVLDSTFDKEEKILTTI